MPNIGQIPHSYVCVYLWLASWETDSCWASQDFVCAHYISEHKQFQAEQKPAFLLHDLYVLM